MPFKKPVKKKTKGKKPGHENLNAKPVSFTGVKQQQSTLCSTSTICSVLAVLLLILMVDLYFFVEDTPNMRPREQEPAPEPQKKNFTRAQRKPMFMATEELQLEALSSLITEMDDRILIAAFEEANAEGAKKQVWRRWERIARAIPNKKQFKRADEDELPRIIRLDCTFEKKAACEQILAGRPLPAVVFWKSGLPRFMPEDVRTDTQVYNYLAKQMLDAVQYQETADDAQFYATNDEGINLLYFGKDTEGAYRQAAMRMRDEANFARTADPEIAKGFNADMPSLRMYRNFDESPISFNGNISDYNEILNWAMSYSVPLFGEWNKKTVKLYQNRKLPVIFIAVDPTEDETEKVLEVGAKLAEEYWGTYSLTQVDAIMNADLAQRLGVSELPEVLILSGSETRKKIDLDNPEDSIRAAIAEWKENANKPKDTESTELDEEYDDYEEYGDEEYEEGDLDEGGEGDKEEEEQTQDREEL